MQLTLLSLFCATLLNGGVDADVKECQDIKSKFLGGYAIVVRQKVHKVIVLIVWNNT